MSIFRSLPLVVTAFFVCVIGIAAVGTGWFYITAEAPTAAQNAVRADDVALWWEHVREANRAAGGDASAREAVAERAMELASRNAALSDGAAREVWVTGYHSAGMMLGDDPRAAVAAMTNVGDRLGLLSSGVKADGVVISGTNPTGPSGAVPVDHPYAGTNPGTDGGLVIVDGDPTGAIQPG